MILSRKQTIAHDYLSPENKEVTEVLYGGSAGGGKSWYGCFWQIQRRIFYAGTRGAICRKELTTLKKTTLKTFFDVWEAYGKHNPFGITYKYNQIEGIIKFSNGSEIFLRELKFRPSDPDYNFLGSLELTDAFIDEVAEIKKRGYEVLKSRIRYKLHLVGSTPKMFCSCNPTNNWVKWRWVFDKKGRPVKLNSGSKFISATVDDNPDESFRVIYKKNLEELNAYDKARLLHGDWTIIENEQPFFHAFSREKHVLPGIGNVDFSFPLELSFDFNMSPTTALKAQYIPGNGFYFYYTVQVDGGTEILCNELVDNHGVLMHPAGMTVTGDYSGNMGSSSAGLLPGGDYNTDYTIIKSKFFITDYDLIDTRTANKRHEFSRRLCNAFLTRLPVFIYEDNNFQLIEDLTNAQRTDKGTLRKDREQFKMDAADAFRYAINAWCPNGMESIQDYALEFGV